MTRLWQIDDAPSAEQLIEIAEVLRSSGVVLLPTDTIYGLHALATDEKAVARVAELKGREETKPFIVLASSIDQLGRLGVSVGAEVLESLAAIWPAPLTAILSLFHPIPASRGGDSLAVRIPDLPWLRELAALTGPLVSTSANRSGEPPATSPAGVAREWQQRLDGIVDGGVREGEPSAVLDLSGAHPRFLRERDGLFTQKVWKTLRKSL